MAESEEKGRVITKERVKRFVAAFTIVLVLMLLFEVVFRHMAPGAPPWSTVPDELRENAPRLLLIAVAVALVLSVRAPSPK